MITHTHTDSSPAARNVTLAQIETGCQGYDRESAELETLISALETDLEEVKRKHLRAIKRQASVVATAQAELHSLIESAPELFKKPRSITVHGVKAGFTVSNGSLAFADEDTVIRLIKRHHEEEEWPMLIRTTEKVNKDGLRALSAVELAKLGCSIADAGDVVLLKRVAGDVEKLIDKMIAKLVEAMVENE